MALKFRKDIEIFTPEYALPAEFESVPERRAVVSVSSEDNDDTQIDVVRFTLAGAYR